MTVSDRICCVCFKPKFSLLVVKTGLLTCLLLLGLSGCGSDNRDSADSVDISKQLQLNDLQGTDAIDSGLEDVDSLVNEINDDVDALGRDINDIAGDAQDATQTDLGDDTDLGCEAIKPEPNSYILNAFTSNSEQGQSINSFAVKLKHRFAPNQDLFTTYPISLGILTAKIEGADVLLDMEKFGTLLLVGAASPNYYPRDVIVQNLIIDGKLFIETLLAGDSLLDQVLVSNGLDPKKTDSTEVLELDVCRLDAGTLTAGQTELDQAKLNAKN